MIAVAVSSPEHLTNLEENRASGSTKHGRPRNHYKLDDAEGRTLTSSSHKLGPFTTSPETIHIRKPARPPR